MTCFFFLFFKMGLIELLAQTQSLGQSRPRAIQAIMNHKRTEPGCRTGVITWIKNNFNYLGITFVKLRKNVVWLKTQIIFYKNRTKAVQRNIVPHRNVKWKHAIPQGRSNYVVLFYVTKEWSHWTHDGIICDFVVSSSRKNINSLRKQWFLWRHW